MLGDAWGPPGLCREWTKIHGQTNMTTYGRRFCIWTSGGPQALQTHRKASTNTLPCILKHLTAFGGDWEPPEIHTGYEPASINAHDPIWGQVLYMDLWRSPGISKHYLTFPYAWQSVTGCVGKRRSAWNGSLLVSDSLDVDQIL